MLRPCPICLSSGARERLWEQRFFEGPLGDSYHVCTCSACGAGFADSIPDQNALDRYYAERSKYTYTSSQGVESPYDFNRFVQIVDQLMPYLKHNGARILDIGCATGGLLSVLKARGFNNLTGSDPSASCAEVANKLYGLNVRISALNDHANWGDKFDVILLVGVLEHVRDLRPALAICRKLLEPEGIIYCAQPDVEAFSLCRNAPFQQFSTEHINYFSKHSLTRLMRLSGFVPHVLQQWIVEWRESVTDSILSGCFALGTWDDSAERDLVTHSGLLEYINKSRSAELVVSQLISGLVNSRQPVLVWGVGSYARHLLATTELRRGNIIAFIDSSPHTGGQTINSFDILNPESAARYPHDILIASVAFAGEIIHDIRTKYKMNNRILTLDGNQLH